MANILLFGGGLQMLSVARSLKEENHKVIATTKNDCIAMKSRFIDLHVNMENDTEAERVAAHLIGLIRELKIDVVIPMEDAQATSLCKGTGLRQGHFRVDLPGRCLSAGRSDGDG